METRYFILDFRADFFELPPYQRQPVLETIEPLERMYQDNYAIEEKLMREQMDQMLRENWSIPYSWFLAIKEFLGSLTIKTVKIHNSRVIFEYIRLDQVFDWLTYPAITFVGTGLAGTAGYWWWNKIYWSTVSVLPNTSCTVIDVNRRLWQSLSYKSFLSEYLTTKLKAAFTEQKIQVVNPDKTIQGLVKKVLRYLKWRFPH